MPVTDAQRLQLESLQSRIVSHIKIKALNLAQVEFVDLLRRITQTIQRPLQDAPGGAPAGGARRPAGGPRLTGIATWSCRRVGWSCRPGCGTDGAIESPGLLTGDCNRRCPTSPWPTGC